VPSAFDANAFPEAASYPAGGPDSAEYFEILQIEHDHGLVVARGGEAMSGGLRHGRSVRALDARDFSEQRPAVFIDYHHPILPGDKPR